MDLLIQRIQIMLKNNFFYRFNRFILRSVLLFSLGLFSLGYKTAAADNFITLEPHNIQTIRPGLTYQTYMISPIGGWLKMMVIDPKQFELQIVRSDPEQSNMPQTLSQFAESHQAIAAINGGFFKLDANRLLGFQPAVPLKIQSHWINPSSRHATRGAVGWTQRHGAIYFDQIQTVKPKDFNLQPKYQVLPTLNPHMQSHWGSLDYIIGGAPLLRINHQNLSAFKIEKMKPSFVNEAHYRTVIGLTTDRQWLLINTSALNLETIQNVLNLKILNCQSALNLDGGDSSGLYLQTQQNWNTSFFNLFQRPIDHAIIVLPRKN